MMSGRKREWGEKGRNVVLVVFFFFFFFFGKNEEMIVEEVIEDTYKVKRQISFPWMRGVDSQHISFIIVEMVRRNRKEEMSIKLSEQKFNLTIYLEMDTNMRRVCVIVKLYEENFH